MVSLKFNQELPPVFLICSISCVLFFTSPGEQSVSRCWKLERWWETSYWRMFLFSDLVTWCYRCTCWHVILLCVVVVCWGGDEASRKVSILWSAGYRCQEDLEQSTYPSPMHEDCVTVYRATSCHVVLQDWERTDNVIEECQRHCPECEMLNQLLHTRTCANSSFACNGMHHPPTPRLGLSSVPERLFSLTSPGPSKTQVSNCSSWHQMVWSLRYGVSLCFHSLSLLVLGLQEMHCCLEPFRFRYKKGTLLLLIYWVPCQLYLPAQLIDQCWCVHH